MSSKPIKTLIIEDDEKHAGEIKSALPSYYETTVSRYSGAKARLTDKTNIPDVVIMDADDELGLSFVIYRYMKESINQGAFANIPVILITADDLSESSMRFYELGDPYFYVGDINQDDFFAFVSDAIEEEEIRDDDNGNESDFINELDNLEELTEKITKLIGKSHDIKLSDNDPLRIAVFKNPEMLAAIESVTGKNKEEINYIIDMITDVCREEEANSAVRFSKHQEEVQKKETEVKKTGDTPVKKSSADVTSGNVIKSDGLGSSLAKNGLSLNNAFGQDADEAEDLDPNRKRQILIVDNTDVIQKAFELFFEDKYLITHVESNIKATDFIIKNRADIVVIEYNMPDITGTSILKSLRLQPNGRKCKAVMVAEKEMTSEVMTKCQALSLDILGVVEKPLVKKQLVSVLGKA